MSKRFSVSKDQIEILNTDDQNAIIASLQREADEQSLRFRRVFSFLYFFVGSMLVFCLCRFLIEPFGLPFEARFQELVSFEAMVLFYGSSIAIFYSQALFLLKVNSFFC